MKKLYSCLTILVFVFQSFSQDNPVAKWPKAPKNKYRCFTDEVDSWRISRTNNQSPNSVFETWMSGQVRQLNELSTTGRGTPIIYSIPVIFPIVHNGEVAGLGTTIAALQVNAQIQQLNNDFRNIAVTSGYTNHAFEADVQIQFCAATVDPTNNALAV